MSKKQLYFIVFAIIIVGIIASALILAFGGNIMGQKQKGTTDISQDKSAAPQVPTAAFPAIEERKSEPLSSKPLPEEKTEEIKKQIEEEKKEEQKMAERKIANPLLPQYPIFNAEGAVMEIKENGFIIKTQYGNYNAVFSEDTLVFEGAQDAVPTKGKAGLYFLQKNQTVAISTLNSLNENKTLILTTVRVIK